LAIFQVARNIGVRNFVDTLHENAGLKQMSYQSNLQTALLQALFGENAEVLVEKAAMA